jgi:hypothetical protein
MSTTAVNGTIGPLDYIERGFAPIPVPHKSKRPVLDGWQKLRITEADLPKYFPAGKRRNVGLLLGEPSGGLIDIDLDSSEAVRAAAYLLPPTGLIAGRKTNPKSHYFYVVDDPPQKAKEEFLDQTGDEDKSRGREHGELLLELRSTGGQTVVEPSVHDETSEIYKWHEFSDAGIVTIGELRLAAGAVAAAALLARHWPVKGRRHDLLLALTGGLLRGGFGDDRTEDFVRAICAAAGADKVETQVGGVKDTREKLDAGEEVTGWPTVVELLGKHGEKIVEQVRRWLGIEEPFVLRGGRASVTGAAFAADERPWPSRPDEAAFYGLPGRIVRAIEPATEADPTAILAQVVVQFGNIVGRGAYVKVEADHHHANEFVLLVGRTGKGRKGTAWGRAHAPFRDIEPTWASDCVQSGVSSGEGVIWAVRDPIHKPERVKEGGNVRYDDVVSDPGVTDKRLMIYEPEYASVLKQTERQGNTVSAVLRQAWDGHDLRILTKNSPGRATEPHISLVGHITTEEFRRNLSSTEAANGFANRNLIVCADRSKKLPEGGQVDQDVMATLAAELASALTFAKTAGELRFDDEARAFWREVYDELSEGKPGLFGSLLGRSEAHVLRLSMIFALTDSSRAIGPQHLMAAVSLWEFCERSIAHIFGDDLGDPVADDLLRVLRSRPDGTTRTEIFNYFGRHQNSGRIAQALGLLLKHGLARVEEQATGGRPVEKWFPTRR